MALLGIPSKWGSQNELFRQKRFLTKLLVFASRRNLDREAIDTKKKWATSYYKDSDKDNGIDSLFSETLLYKSESFGWDLEEWKQACPYGKEVWRWRRSNLTRTISKSRTSKIPMQGMKCTTLKSNGLPEVETLELTPGWKSTMLALFGKFGLSELWYKDQNKRLFTGILRNLR